MTFYVRTLECAPGNGYGNVVDRTAYEEIGEARTVRDRCIATEAAARERSEHPTTWYLFDIAEVRPEQEVATISIGNAGRVARQWAQEQRNKWATENGKERWRDEQG